MSSKIRDLNNRLEDIRREQQYQREREADYRDLSEATNSKAVWYSLAQIIVLVATCAWQMRHLKVRGVLALNSKRFLTLLLSGSLKTGRCGDGHVHLSLCLYALLYRFIYYRVPFHPNRRTAMPHSTFNNTFLPYFPSANALKTPLTASLACASVRSFPIFTTSISGVSNYARVKPAPTTRYEGHHSPSSPRCTPPTSS